MKKKIVLILMGLLIISLPVMAEEKPATQIEEFITKKGQIIVKEFYDVETLPGHLGKYTWGLMKITALVIYQPGIFDKLYGLKIYIEEEGKYPDKNTSFLDFEELISLSEALGYMIELSGKWALAEREYTEVFFQTEGDYKIGFYQEGLKQTAFSQSGRIGSASIWLRMSDLEIIKSSIEKGLAKLESLGAS